MHLIDANDKTNRLYVSQEVFDCMQRIPPIDPESLRLQGEWVETDYKPYWYTKCSLCGHRIMLADKSHHNYCPNCGAKMKGGTP